MKELFELKDSVVVVAGGTGVIGSSVSRYLAEHGARVVVLGRNAEDGMSLVNEITAFGGQAIFLMTNVLDKDILEGNLSDIISEYGTIYALINIADNDIAVEEVCNGSSVFDIDIEIFRKVIDSNLMGTIVPIQVFLKTMIANGNGCVINVSSMTTFSYMPKVAGFAAAKAAINNITAFIAKDLAANFNNKVRVNSIEAGLFLTKDNRTIFTNNDGSLTEKGKEVIQSTPFSRFIEPEELCGTIGYLLSDKAKDITGQIVTIDDGFNMFSK